MKLVCCKKRIKLAHKDQIMEQKHSDCGII